MEMARFEVEEAAEIMELDRKKRIEKLMELRKSEEASDVPKPSSAEPADGKPASRLHEPSRFSCFYVTSVFRKCVISCVYPNCILGSKSHHPPTAACTYRGKASQAG